MQCFAASKLPMNRNVTAGLRPSRSGRPFPTVALLSTSRLHLARSLLRKRSARPANRSLAPVAASYSSEGQKQIREDPLSINDLKGAPLIIRRVGWISFWTQLALSITSSIILFFSAASVNQAQLPQASTWLTLVGIVLSFFSTFLASGYVRTARKMLEGGEVKLPQMVGSFLRNNAINLWGIGATVVALQAEVGTLVAKALLTSSTSPYQAARQAGTPAALDIFTIQASTNTIFAHFLGIVFTNFLLRQVNRRTAAATNA